MAGHAESVWDYPRPPRVEPTDCEVVVRHKGAEIARSRRAHRVLETGHPPSYYIPPQDVRLDLLETSRKRTVCEFKGTASYHTVRTEHGLALDAAWSYPEPTPPFAAIRGHLAFYPSRVECFVDGERARPEVGRFYGGWITGGIADAQAADPTAP